MSEPIKNVLDFYGVTPFAYVKCPVCGEICSVKLDKVDPKLPKSTLPWVLFYKDLYKLPMITCCNVEHYPEYIHLQAIGERNINIDEADAVLTDEHNNQIGSIKTPVVTDDILEYPITRTYQEQLNIQKQIAQQNKLLARTQDAFYKSCYSYFSIHFEQIIQEIDGEEILDVLNAMANTRFGIHLSTLKVPDRINKKDKKAYMNWMKKQIRFIVEQNDEESKQIVFYLIVRYFAEWELIQGIYYLRWNAKKYEKMIGKTLLYYMILQFPLTNYFSYLREETLHKLMYRKSNNRHQSLPVYIIQKDLDKAYNQINKMQQLIDRQKETILQLENKLADLEMKNASLQKQVQDKEEVSICQVQTKKIKELKGIIDEMRVEINCLREQRASEMLEDCTGGDSRFHNNDQEVGTGKPQVLDDSILEGKVIGIFGDVQISKEDNGNHTPYTIINSSTVQDAEGISVMNRSSIIVVLTQHIAHSCMWTLKSYASAHELPILFSRHTNVQIIIDQVIALLAKKQKSEQNYKKDLDTPLLKL